MLPVVNLFSLADLAARQQIRIPTSADRPRLSADHRSKVKATRTDIALSHAHDPVNAARLAGPAITGLVKRLQEGIFMKHDQPGTALPMERVHWRVIGQPRSTRRLSRHRHLPHLWHLHLLLECRWASSGF